MPHDQPDTPDRDAKRAYEAPRLRSLGKLAEVTSATPVGTGVDSTYAPNMS